MTSGPLILVGLLVTNAIIYSLISLKVLRRRRPKVRVSNLAEAFRALENALKKAVPDLPPGLTWEEALDRVGVEDYNRHDVESALEKYEAYRFGGVPVGESDYSEVVRVANLLGGSRPDRRA